MNEPTDEKALVRAVKIMQSFVHDYHEKNEEDLVFPRFERAGKRVALVRTLREQHDAGGASRRACCASGRAAVERHRRAQGARRRFAPRDPMYEPHAAREDTVLFPSLHELVTPREYDELSDTFEDQETKLFGEHGFERIVGELGDVEHAFGIEDLAQFSREVTLIALERCKVHPERSEGSLHASEPRRKRASRRRRS